MGLPGSDYFAFEACEYRRHFLSYHPDYAIMTNIDFDHPDYFKNIDDVYDAFQHMALNVKKGIIAWGDDEYLRKLDVDIPVYYYGFKETDDIYAKNIQITEKGTQFDVYIKGEFYDQFLSPQYGNHNILNALAVIAISYLENMNVENIKEALITFGGVKRRFNETKVSNQVLVDDYAHHPREISATIETARKNIRKRCCCRFSTTYVLKNSSILNEFAESLSKADQVFLCEIFGSIRENTGDLTIEDLINRIDGSTLIDENSIDVLEKFDNAVILFMGAGDIQKLLKAYFEKLGVKMIFNMFI